MIGARDMAFPRLNALSYWLFLLGGIVLLLSFFARGGAADTGWTAYVPLSTLHSPGHGQDLWILSLHILSISSAGGRDQLHRDDPQHARAGNELDAHPALLLEHPHLCMDADHRAPDALGRADDDAARPPGRHELLQPGARAAARSSTSTSSGSSATPRSTSSILPTMGIISEIIPVFARKPIFGYKAVAFSTLGDRRSSRCSSGRTTCSRSACRSASNIFFMLSSMVIADPDGREDHQLARDDLARQHLVRHADALGDRVHQHLHDRRPLGDLPRGVPDRPAVTDSYFVVAHMHYVLFGGSVFGDLRRALLLVAEDVRAAASTSGSASWHFWLVFVGFNVTFFPQHMLGLLGMPRRVYTYHDARALGGLQHDLVDRRRTLMAVGMLVFVCERHQDVRHRASAPATTPGSPTRSSGTRPRRRRPGTSTSCRT